MNLFHLNIYQLTAVQSECDYIKYYILIRVFFNSVLHLSKVLVDNTIVLCHSAWLVKHQETIIVFVVFAAVVVYIFEAIFY